MERKMVSVELSLEMIKQIKEITEKEGLSRAWIMRKALVEYLDHFSPQRELKKREVSHG